jgi:hypothetical protein
MNNGELSSYLILPDALWSSDRLKLTEIFTIYLLGVKIGGQHLRPTNLTAIWTWTWTWTGHGPMGLNDLLKE